MNDLFLELIDSFFLRQPAAFLWPWAEKLSQLSAKALYKTPHGHLDRYQDICRCLAELVSDHPDQQALHSLLWGLRPWRKGPFTFGPVVVDSEWRSNLKLERLLQALDCFDGAKILDLGCGNGYYLFELLQRGASSALGIEPMVLYNAQGWAQVLWSGQQNLAILPLRDSDIPAQMACFDVVLSMGVVYHHQDAWSHVARCASQLLPGGRLVLESIVVPGTALQLDGKQRYSKMRNVWTIPTVQLMTDYLSAAGLEDIRLIDISQTTADEQRPSDWMQFESLPDFLNPSDASQTIEGYPAPYRAMLIARRGYRGAAL